MSRPCPIAARAYVAGSQRREQGHSWEERTCLPDNPFGRLGMFIRWRPTPMAPELTSTTLWPILRSLTTVSTTDDSVERRGWCVVSCTIDEVPARRSQQRHSAETRSLQNLPSLITTVHGVPNLCARPIPADDPWCEAMLECPLIYTPKYQDWSAGLRLSGPRNYFRAKIREDRSKCGL